MQGKPEKRQLEDDREMQESPSILYKLDLGQHTLCLMTDGSIDLLAHEEEPVSHVFRGLRLDADETYRLFISLHEQYRDGRQG